MTKKKVMEGKDKKDQSSNHIHNQRPSWKKKLLMQISKTKEPEKS